MARTILADSVAGRMLAWFDVSLREADLAMTHGNFWGAEGVAEYQRAWGIKHGLENARAALLEAVKLENATDAERDLEADD